MISRYARKYKLNWKNYKFWMSAEIKIFSNLPFSAPPDLEKNPVEEGGLTIQDETPFQVVDLGLRGTIRHIEVQPDLDTNRPVVFPAGPALPLRIDAYLQSLTSSGLQRLGFCLLYKGRILSRNSPI